MNALQKRKNMLPFWDLLPSEDSSGDSQNRDGITKAGNSHLRRLLVEAAQGYTRGATGHKSVALRQRQHGNTPRVIAYADKQTKDYAGDFIK